MPATAAAGTRTTKSARCVRASFNSPLRLSLSHASSVSVCERHLASSRPAQWGLRQGCSISWPRHIAKHFTQAQLRGLNDGRDQDGGMGNHWDKVRALDPQIPSCATCLRATLAYLRLAPAP